MTDAISLKPIYLEQNKGLGNALKVALANCTNNLVARMDSDDISAPYRFEKQIRKFVKHPDLDIVGGNITEFVGTPENVIGERAVELSDSAIKKNMKKRCAMNHVSVMYKKDAVMASGGYQDWHYNEDYYLWIRMLEHGCKFANVPYPLVNVRTGLYMSARRGGWKYFRSEQLLQKYMPQKKIISFPEYAYNVLLRFGGELVATDSMRQQIYNIIRKKPSTSLTRGKNDIKASRSKKTEYPPFSVATSVYAKDNPEWFDIALDSLVNQTVKPAEIVLVVDGPVPKEIHDVIDKYKKICAGGGVNLRVLSFLKNKGLGEALKASVEHCSHELIARMDSDDISVKNRFELQLEKFVSEPVISICGGQISEFIDEPGNVVGRRIVPGTDHEIKVYMKKRCPFNHMTVMFKKSDVLRVGNYRDWFWNEDYYLWIRMALEDMKFANLPESLVDVRVGADMYNRRGGDRYFKSEIAIQKLMLGKGMIGYPIYLANCSKRFIVQKLLPNNIRGLVFRLFARS